MLAAAVEGQDRNQTLADLVRYHGRLVRTLGQGQQKFGRLTVERNLLRQELEKLEASRTVGPETTVPPLADGAEAADEER